MLGCNIYISTGYNGTILQYTKQFTPKSVGGKALKTCGYAKSIFSRREGCLIRLSDLI